MFCAGFQLLEGGGKTGVMGCVVALMLFSYQYMLRTTSQHTFLEYMSSSWFFQHVEFDCCDHLWLFAMTDWIGLTS